MMMKSMSVLYITAGYTPWSMKNVPLLFFE